MLRPEPQTRVRPRASALAVDSARARSTCDSTQYVVLADFWTYTCINWLRQLPYVRAWAGKYSGAGLVVIGVHTPEFGSSTMWIMSTAL